MLNGSASEAGRWSHALDQTGTFSLCVLDADRIIRYWNLGGEKLLGYTSEEIIGKTADILFLQGESAPPSLTTLTETANQDGSANLAQNMLRRDGAEVFVEGTLNAVRDGGDSISEYTLLLREGSGIRKLQRAAERTAAELDQFAFTVSHDLKAPLRSVKSFSELLQRRCKGLLDEDATEYIGYIVDGAKQMEQLLGDILAFSQAGREDKTRPQVVDTTGVLQWAVMNVDTWTRQTSATITWDPLPDLFVDQNQLAQLFQHLLTNSMKFRSEAAPVIHISAKPVDSDLIEFAIRDNGIGIDPSQHDRIFGIFKRLHGRDIPGTGIGLSICRRIVEVHGGRIWVESEAGAGSTFHFTLKAA